MLVLQTLALSQMTFASDLPFGLPVWLPILIFLILIFSVLWLTYSFQDEKPEYLPPWAILPSVEMPHSQTPPPSDDHDARIQSNLPLEAGASAVHSTNMVEAPSSASPMASPAVPVADDLERIEGIGPVIARLLLSNGITTFQDLARTDLSKLASILSDANLRIADPGSWPEQAALAASGRWDELDKLQENLKAGRYRPS